MYVDVGTYSETSGFTVVYVATCERLIQSGNPEIYHQKKKKSGQSLAALVSNEHNLPPCLAASYRLDVGELMENA